MSMRYRFPERDSSHEIGDAISRLLSHLVRRWRQIAGFFGGGARRAVSYERVCGLLCAKVAFPCKSPFDGVTWKRHI